MACQPEMTQEEIRQLLSEARKAYHQLMTGTAVVEVRDQNGESVRFSAARRSDLYAYIQDLASQLIVAGCPRRPNGPARFIF
jgi:gpW.